MSNKPSWQSGHFSDEDTDPLAGFANIMDVMLVFALGLMLALISQSRELRQHFSLPEKPEQGVRVKAGKELNHAPESMQKMIDGNNQGMEAVGQVYRDPKTGKLILIDSQ